MTVEFQVFGESPEFVAAIIVETNDPVAEWEKEQKEAIKQWQLESKTDHFAKFPMPSPMPIENYNDKAKWVPFKTNLVISLGPGDGPRKVLFGYKYKGETECNGWSGGSVDVQTKRPFIIITYPRQTITWQPIILLKGYNSDELQSIRYDVLSQDGGITRSNGEGFVNDQDYDPNLGHFTTNYFTCDDIPLTPGTNTIILRCQDRIGNTISTNLIFVLDTKYDRPPPAISIDWPKQEMIIQTGTFAARGSLDDGTEKIVGEISANGQTNTINGVVAWSHSVDGAGYFWLYNLPISLGTNCLTLTAVNTAGISSSTNLTLYGDEEPVVTMDPVAPGDKLYQPYIDVTGNVRPANNNVWVNGVKATVNPDGTWLAKQVPIITANLGTACFDMTTTPPPGTTNDLAKPSELFYAQTSLGTNAIILNPSTPICGVFRLHIDNSSKRNFVLFASTNLTVWEPILTNSSADATFDYTDQDINYYPCRFFRVAPLQ